MGLELEEADVKLVPVLDVSNERCERSHISEHVTSVKYSKRLKVNPRRLHVAPLVQKQTANAFISCRPKRKRAEGDASNVCSRSKWEEGSRL